MTDRKSFSLKVRVLHMVLFELVAIILFAPIAAFVLDKSVMEIGALGGIISLIAMLWNFLYNCGFDMIELALNRNRFQRSVITRVIHALCFELGLLIVTVPLVAFWLRMTLLQAFLVDIAFVVFFLVYAFVYNWVFDAVYLKYSRE